MKQAFFSIIVVFVLLGCRSNEALPADTVKEGNRLTTIASDTQRLARLLDLSVYKPVRVRYKYVLFDNSGSRLTVPGPSDYYLEALLEFDSATMARLREAYRLMDYPDPQFAKKQFQFDWLDKGTSGELAQSDTAYHGQPDAFFGMPNGKLWMLDRKVLLFYEVH